MKPEESRLNVKTGRVFFKKGSISSATYIRRGRAEVLANQEEILEQIWKNVLPHQTSACVTRCGSKTYDAVDELFFFKTEYKQKIKLLS
jgi:hypothetical protein